VAPPTLTSSGSYRSIADAASIRIERVAGRSRDAAEGRGAVGADGVAAAAEEDGEPEVIHINLSAAVTNPHSLPESVKLQSAGARCLSECDLFTPFPPFFHALPTAPSRFCN
jgi:hypothetical protein